MCGALLTLLMSLPVASTPATPPQPDASDETRISIDVKDASIIDVVRLLAEVGSFQVVIDPGVSCSLTLKLKAVQWPTVLDQALKACSLAVESETGIYRVAPVARLTEESAARRKLEEERRLSGPTRTVRYRLSYARAAELAPILKRFLSPRGEVVVDERTNTLIVTDVE